MPNWPNCMEPLTGTTPKTNIEHKTPMRGKEQKSSKPPCLFFFRVVVHTRTSYRDPCMKSELMEVYHLLVAFGDGWCNSSRIHDINQCWIYPLGLRMQFNFNGLQLCWDSGFPPKKVSCHPSDLVVTGLLGRVLNPKSMQHQAFRRFLRILTKRLPEEQVN